MNRSLIVTFDGGGNVPVMLAIADELRRRGRFVTVMTHPPMQSIPPTA